MIFNTHSGLKDQHAFLSPSKYHWINYDDEKLFESFSKYQASVKGTRLHDFARQCIELGIKLPKTKNTLNLYVNDAIGFKMTPEQILYYSENCFGTADSISFRNNFLRIHDYKSGQTPASIHQLEVYTALFCLEYKIKPFDMDIELRLYQSNEVLIHAPTADDILYIHDKIIDFDKQINKLKIG